MQSDTYIVSIKPMGSRRRTRDTMLTLLMWGIYIYLWIPLICLLLVTVAPRLRSLLRKRR